MKETDKIDKAKATFSKNLYKLRLQRGLTQAQLAEALNVNKTSIHEWETGKKLPVSGNIEKTAEFFNIPKSALWTEEGDSFFTYEKMIKLPIVGKISCGNGVFAYDNIEGYESTPKEWLNGGEYIYTRVQGDSMINARIYDGDLVLIRRQSDVDDGEIAAVLVNEQIFLKRIYKKNGTLILQSENPKYPPIICTPEKDSFVCIIGKLKKIIINI